MIQPIWRVLAILLTVLLVACSPLAVAPSNQLVQQALALELTQTQQELHQQLRLDHPEDQPEISRLVIQEMTPLVIQGLQSFHVRGTYNLTVHLSDRRVTQSQNPFDLYLQRQPEGKTWRLAHYVPEGEDGPTWLTQLIPTY